MSKRSKHKLTILTAVSTKPQIHLKGNKGAMYNFVTRGPRVPFISDSKSAINEVLNCIKVGQTLDIDDKNV